MTDNNLNLFILLDIDPDQPWNQAEFERCLQQKRREWSGLVNLPSKKGIEAKRNLGLIPKLTQIAQEEAERTRQAAEVRNLKNQQRADQLQMLSKDLEWLQKSGNILEDQLKNLITKYAGTISEVEIRKLLTVSVIKEPKESEPPSLDPTTASIIQQNLQSLKKANLYDFLDLPPTTEIRILHERADQLYIGVTKKGSKSPEDDLTLTLSGYCLKIFKAKDEKAKYDQSLRLQNFEEIKEKINLAGTVIAAAQVEQLLLDAKSKGFEPDKALSKILEYAQKKGIGVVMPAKPATDSIKRMQRCGCGYLNAEDKKYCTVCGELLTEACPKCGKNVASDQMACGACGFPTGNRTWVQFLLNEAKQAFDGRDYPVAKDFLDQASRAWPGATTGPIQQRLKELESQIAPAKEQQAALLRQLKAAVQDKRFYAARDLLAQTGQILPAGSNELTTTRQEVETAIRQVESKLAAARRSEATDPEKLVQIYYDAVQICRDCQEAKDALARTPPSGPTSVQATVGGTVIHLTWQPSLSRDVRYTVVRKQRSRPVSVGDGEKLATVAGTVYDDATAEVGVPIFYAVFADREGVSSKDGATVATPVLLLAEVTQLMAQVSDRRVSLQWQTPPNIDDIVVLRSDRGYPRSITDGQRIPLLGKQQAVDTGVENDRKYFYTVICQFVDYSGKRITTSGVHAEAIPQQPPEPIRELRIVASGPLHDRQIDLQWQPPRKGEVVIIKSDKPLGLNLGDVVPRQALAKYGNVLAAIANQARDKISQFGFYYYLPVVVFQDTAYIGQEQRYVCVDDVSGLSVQNLGHALRLQWEWPANCQEAIVAYSHQDWPQPGASGTAAVSLTKAQYDLRGYHDISNPTQADYYTTVFAVINHDGQRITSAGQTIACRKRITLKSRIGLTYEIKKPWFGSNFTLTLDINGQGTVPALLLVRKQNGLPMTKADGEIVLRLPPQSVSERRLTIKLPEDVKRPQSFAQLFLEEDEGYEFVTIRKPDRDKLRLF